jgi:hypothetical protein
MLVPCCGTNFVLREETIVRRTFAKTGLATDASRKEYFSLGEAFAADSRIRQRAIGIVGSMRLFRRFTSSDPREVVARCPASSPVMASPSKKVCGRRSASEPTWRVHADAGFASEALLTRPTSYLSMKQQ